MNKRNLIYILCIILFLIIIGCFVFWRVSKLEKKITDNQVESGLYSYQDQTIPYVIATNVDTEGLVGYVYFAHNTLDSERSFIARYDMADKTISQVNPQENLYERAPSVVGDQLYFLGTPFEPQINSPVFSTYPYIEDWGIYRGDSSSDKPIKIKKIDFGHPHAMEVSRVNNQTKIALMGLKKSDTEAEYSAREESRVFPELFSIKDWNIYIYEDDQSDPIVISEAASPFWSLDGKSLYMLKKDGAYEYVISEKRMKKIFTPPKRVEGIDAGLPSGSRIISINDTEFFVIWNGFSYGVAVFRPQENGYLEYIKNVDTPGNIPYQIGGFVSQGKISVNSNKNKIIYQTIEEYGGEVYVLDIVSGEQEKLMDIFTGDNHTTHPMWTDQLFAY